MAWKWRGYIQFPHGFIAVLEYFFWSIFGESRGWRVECRCPILALGHVFWQKIKQKNQWVFGRFWLFIKSAFNMLKPLDFRVWFPNGPGNLQSRCPSVDCSGHHSCYLRSSQSSIMFHPVSSWHGNLKQWRWTVLAFHFFHSFHLYFGDLRRVKCETFGTPVPRPSLLELSSQIATLCCCFAFSPASLKATWNMEMNTAGIEQTGGPFVSHRWPLETGYASNDQKNKRFLGQFWWPSHWISGFSTGFFHPPSSTPKSMEKTQQFFFPNFFPQDPSGIPKSSRRLLTCQSRIRRGDRWGGASWCLQWDALGRLRRGLLCTLDAGFFWEKNGNIQWKLGKFHGENHGNHGKLEHIFVLFYNKFSDDVGMNSYDIP